MYIIIEYMDKIFSYNVNDKTNTLTTDDKRQIRKINQKMTKFKCYYCGNVFFSQCKIERHIKTPFGSEQNNSDEHTTRNDVRYEQCCQMCFVLTNYSTKYSKYIKIFESDMSQYTIIKNTIDFIRKYKNVPKYIDIDKNIKDDDGCIKTGAFFSIVSNGFINKKLKAFFTNLIDIDYIVTTEQDTYNPFLNFDMDDTNSDDIVIDNVYKTMKRLTKWNEKFIKSF